MRILVVEDEPEISAFLKTSLEAKCFSVDVAPDGERGSYWARTTDYDLVILDNLLPKASGLEVCRAIRKSGRQLPILILSVQSEPSVKTALLNAGADDYLSKPFSHDELLARVNALLRRPRRIENEVLRADDLALNTSTFEVTRGERQTYLTRKEFMLLNYLLRNKGSVLSRAMLLEHVWDMDTDPFSNTIESHIASLRKKIDTSKKKRLIHTVPGRGYKIEG